MPAHPCCCAAPVSRNPQPPSPLPGNQGNGGFYVMKNIIAQYADGCGFTYLHEFLNSPAFTDPWPAEGWRWWESLAHSHLWSPLDTLHPRPFGAWYADSVVPAHIPCLSVHHADIIQYTYGNLPPRRILCVSPELPDVESLELFFIQQVEITHAPHLRDSPALARLFRGAGYDNTLGMPASPDNLRRRRHPRGYAYWSMS